MISDCAVIYRLYTPLYNTAADMAPGRGSALGLSAETDDLDAPLPSTIFPEGMTSSRGRRVKPRHWDQEDAPEASATMPSSSATPAATRRPRPPPARPLPEAQLSSSDEALSDEDDQPAYADLAGERLRCAGLFLTLFYSEAASTHDTHLLHRTCCCLACLRN